MSDTRNTPTYAEAYRDLRECRDVARRLVEAANADADRILALQCFTAASDEIEALLLKQLQESSEDYQSLTEQIKVVKGRLERLKERIDEIIVAVEQIAQFVAAVNRVITLLGRIAI